MLNRSGFTYSGIHIGIESIGPHEAALLLESNQNNRKLRAGRVETYARDMMDSRWIFNGEPIRFNGQTLIDGQHRLEAVILSGSRQDFLVVRGLQNEAHSTIDTGLKRGVKDELAWRNVPRSSEVAAVLRLLWKYEAGAILNTHIIPSPGELVDLYEDHQEVIDSVRVVEKVSRETKINRVALATAHYLFKQEHGEKADDFIDALRSGTGYDEGDPCLQLRNMAVKVTSTVKLRPTAVEWLAFIIKAENYWLAGMPLRQLKWTRQGKKKEDFPTVLTLDQIAVVYSD